MTELTKEIWQKLEEEMTCSWVQIEFEYKGHSLSIARVRENESKTCLAVYIDDAIAGKWLCQEDALATVEGAPQIISEVWKVRYISAWKPKAIKEIEKAWGKRRAKKEFPDLHTKIGYYIPYFSKASVLCRQFKKLKGLKLVKADCLKEANNESP